MDRKVRDEWVKALRSGNYVQGSGRLQERLETGDRFCCLGVLCAVAELSGVSVDKDEDGTYASTDPGSLISENIRDWAQMVDDGTYKDGKLYLDNDNGVPFYQIAYIIEREF